MKAVITNHTPGKWKYKPETGSIVSGNGKTVAVLPVYPQMTLNERLGNARLAMSAPDLADALLTIIDITGTDFDGSDFNKLLIEFGKIRYSIRSTAKSALLKAGIDTF